MPVLVFDTETTGKANFKLPSVHPGQPNLVQLACLLLDDDRSEVGSFDCIIKPEGWTVPEEAAAVHGISEEKAHRLGILMVNAVSTFRDFLYVADTIVAHNIVFDELVMDRACAVVDLASGVEVTYPWSRKHRMVCTMREATPIAKVRSKRPQHANDYKWPTLTECTQRFFDEGIDGAHNAMVDVRACARIYWKLVDDGVITASKGRQAKNVYN